MRYLFVEESVATNLDEKLKRKLKKEDESKGGQHKNRRNEISNKDNSEE